MKALWLRFLDWFSRRFGIARTPVPREPLSYRPIGVVRNNVKQPRPDGWDQVRSTIVMREELAEGLDGIEGYSHVLVVFGLHKVPESEQKLRIDERGDGTPALGVFATRSQRRPTAIGVASVQLLRRRVNVLWVQGLDAIDGTPVLDIKPYYPRHDAIPEAGVPEWARRGDEGVGFGAGC